MLKQRIAAFFLISIFVSSCGSSSNWIKKDNLDLASLVEQIRNEFGIPALAIGVVSADEIIDLEIQGVANPETRAVLPEDPRFHLGSISKTMTGFIAGHLVKEEIISWDTSFFELFPKLMDSSRKEYYQSTLKDFLSHRAGIAHRTKWKDFAVPPGSPREQRMAYAEWALQLRPEKKIFSGYNYSNGGIAIAAAMLEQAADLGFEELVEKYINEKYGIDAQSGFPVQFGDNQPRGYMPAGYLGMPGDELVLFDTEYVNAFDDIIVPSGGYNMKVSDFLLYTQIHLNGLVGNDRYLSRADFEFLHYGIKDYSLCWENGTRYGYRFSEHSGSKGNFFSHIVLFPSLDLGIILMANSGIINALKPLEAAKGYNKLDAALKAVFDLYQTESF